MNGSTPLPIDLATIASWPAAFATVAVAGLLIVPQLISAWMSWRTRKDTQVVREQTENNHQDHPFPNMREQLDAIHSDVTGARGELAEVKDQVGKDLEVVRSELSNVKSDFSDHVQQAAAWQIAIESELAAMRRPWWRR